MEANTREHHHGSSRNVGLASCWEVCCCSSSLNNARQSLTRIPRSRACFSLTLGLLPAIPTTIDGISISRMAALRSGRL